MPKSKFYLRGHTRSDITRIRRYIIDTWGEKQWVKYKTALLNKLQLLADNPETGIKIEEISDNAFRFPLKDHVVYYLKGMLALSLLESCQTEWPLKNTC